MKILQVIDSLPTGGGARFVVNLTKELNLKGIKTEVLLLDGTETPFIRELKDAGCEVHSLTIGRRWSVFNVFKIIPYFRQYELLHVHIFPASYFVAVARFFSGAKTKVVFTEHNSQNRRAVHPLFRYVEKWIYRQFDEVVCLTDQVKQFVVDNLRVKSTKLSIIENGVELSAIRNAKLYDKRTMGFRDHDKLILMAARFETQKDHITLINALNLLPQHFHVLFAGTGSRERLVKELTKEMKINNRVHFIGNRQDIYSLMKSCDYNVLSSHFEGLSLFAIESLASGKPFIASNVAGLDFIAGYGVLFEGKNEGELSSKILELENNRELYHETILRCLRRAEDFDSERMVNNYISLYKKVCNL